MTRIRTAAAAARLMIALMICVSFGVAWNTELHAITIPVSNANFDDTTDLTSSLPGDNQYDFVTPLYSGWREFLVSTGAPHDGLSSNNVGPINTSPGDITVQTTSGTVALYQQNSAYRVDQTTSHVISNLDVSFRLGVDVGRDTSGGFAGYRIQLYADNGAGTKTTIKSISSSVDGGNPTTNSYVRKTLELNAADFQAYIGQSIGISLQAESSARPVFYDTVTLEFAYVPEPSSLMVLFPLGMTLIARRSRKHYPCHCQSLC